MLKSSIKGFGEIHKTVQSLISDKNYDLDAVDLASIKRNFDNYLMYIWLHLGDTRFNREGYREATDILQAKIN